MKSQSSSTDWVDNSITALLLLCCAWVWTDAIYFSEPAVEHEKIPVSYCEIEVINRVEENGMLTETSTCLKDSFVWEKHIVETPHKFQAR